MALAVFAILSACLVGVVVRSSPAGAVLAGPYPAATVFRPDGVLNASPATVPLTNRGAAAFVTGIDGNVWWSTQTTGWVNLGQPMPGIIGDPAVVSWIAGRLDVFVEGKDFKLWQRYSNCDGCSWSSWLQPVGTDGTLASPPAVTSWAAGRIDVVVQGTDGNIYERFWDTTAWSAGWQNILSPPMASKPIPQERLAVTTWGPGRMDLFLRGADNKLWQDFLANGAWQGWFQPPGTTLGNLNSAPAADAWNGGPTDGRNRITVFVQGVDNHLYQTTWDTNWSAWNIEGTQDNVFQGSPGAPSTLQVQPYVLVRGTDNKAYAFFPGG